MPEPTSPASLSSKALSPPSFSATIVQEKEAKKYGEKGLKGPERFVEQEALLSKGQAASEGAYLFSEYRDQVEQKAKPLEQRQSAQGLLSGKDIQKKKVSDFKDAEGIRKKLQEVPDSLASRLELLYFLEEALSSPEKEAKAFTKELSQRLEELKRFVIGFETTLKDGEEITAQNLLLSSLFLSGYRRKKELPLPEKQTEAPPLASALSQWVSDVFLPFFSKSHYAREAQALLFALSEIEQKGLASWAPLLEGQDFYPVLAEEGNIDRSFEKQGETFMISLCKRSSIISLQPSFSLPYRFEVEVSPQSVATIQIQGKLHYQEKENRVVSTFASSYSCRLDEAKIILGEKRSSL